MAITGTSIKVAVLNSSKTKEKSIPWPIYANLFQGIRWVINKVFPNHNYLAREFSFSFSPNSVSVVYNPNETYLNMLEALLRHNTTFSGTLTHGKLVFINSSIFDELISLDNADDIINALNKLHFDFNKAEKLNIVNDYLSTLHELIPKPSINRLKLLFLQSLVKCSLCTSLIFSNFHLVPEKSVFYTNFDKIRELLPNICIVFLTATFCETFFTAGYLLLMNRDIILYSGSSESFMQSITVGIPISNVLQVFASQLTTQCLQGVVTTFNLDYLSFYELISPVKGKIFMNADLFRGNIADLLDYLFNSGVRVEKAIISSLKPMDALNLLFDGVKVK